MYEHGPLIIVSRGVKISKMRPCAQFSLAFKFIMIFITYLYTENFIATGNLYVSFEVTEFHHILISKEVWVAFNEFDSVMNDCFISVEQAINKLLLSS